MGSTRRRSIRSSPTSFGTARDEHAASGRDASRFIVTVFAGLEERWLKADSRARQMVERAGVDRLILLVSPPFDPAEIRQAGRLITDLTPERHRRVGRSLPSLVTP